MTIPAGSRLGPYEVLALLGAGGMGEVYRARDTRLDRTVAIKVVREEFFDGEKRRQRFEREAKLLAALNHPNVAAVFSFEEVIRSPASPPCHVLAIELLEGETLRAHLAGKALPVRKAVDVAVQVAKGLAAAHGKGIVHRDLKPENLFLTKDGRVKILDFGLAKLGPAPSAVAAHTDLPTASAGTEAGIVVGTLGYMSPEQVKGEPLDARSDLFAFGAILYEMLSGVSAFRRASAAETMSAILREEPPDLSATNRNIPLALERIVRHCLEKNPEERFDSARDLGFDLEALSTVSGPAAGAPRERAASSPSRRHLAGAVLAAALAGAAIAAVALRRPGPPPPPSFRQITFRRGLIGSARFESDGKTVLYSAAWEGGPMEIFAGRSDGPDSRPFGLKTADVLAVAPSGDVAVALGSKLSPGPTVFSRIGTLARTAATGGAPREILEGVEYADFSPDGRDLAAVHLAAGLRRLEFPVGRVLYETTGWIGNPRISPRGDRIAFLDHPFVGDDGGAVAVVDLAGRKTTLTPVFVSAEGLAWSPDGAEIWFTASESGSRSLRAVTPGGRQRVLFAGTGALTLHDVSRDGRALLTHDLLRSGFAVRGPADGKERELSWFDANELVALSPDGRTALFGEVGEAGGAGYSVYLRGTDGSPAVRLGEGAAESLSPDGKLVLAILRPARDARLVIYPTGPGASKPVPYPDLRISHAAWLPDGRRFLMEAYRPAGPSRIYLADPEGAPPKPLTPEGHRLGFHVGLVDGSHFLSLGPDERVYQNSIDGHTPTPVRGIGPDDVVPGPSGRDGWILVRRGRGLLPARVVRIELASGREERFGEFMPPDPSGIIDVIDIIVARDGRSYGYDYVRVLSDLFVVDGLK